MRKWIAFALQVGDVGRPGSGYAKGCQRFSFISRFFRLSCSGSQLAANEIDYAGDTPAAIVTWITDPGYNAHL